MKEKEIRALLQEAYDREQWKQLVTALFPGRDVFARPVEHEATTVQGRRQVQRMLQFGDVQLADGNLVGLFEVEVAPGVDLTRNRVAIRKAMEQPVKQSGHSGALIAFVDKQQGLWRFSFYSNTLKDDGTWDANTPKRYTYLLGKGEQCLTAARQFDALVQKAGRSTLADLLEAFSVEKVGKAFFREYKEHYQDLVQHLTGKRMVKRAGKWEEKVMHQPSPKLATYFNGSEKDARDFCKKLMGRLVFLYFLQKKRWLGATTTAYTDGDTDFVYRLFRATGGEGFYPTVLTTLFFETLNKERANDDYRMPDGSTRKVPFLNGGLFDMDALDRKTQLLTFPPELFSKPASADDEKDRGFLDFLNAYNFTVHEAGPEEQTLAVDPEMLGHIFENLLEDNKDKGAFYTPKEIVHYMCQESLTQYLKNYLQRHVAGTPPADLEDHLRTFLKDGTGAPLSAYSGLLLKALHDVKVCDPAIGSGAFPMGILHEIFQAVYHLQEFSPDEFSSIWGLEQWEPAEVKLRIIQHSIYGVDIERGAVDIARLRFWLSIIVDERAPRTLPNLDYKIVVGDSLLGKFNKEVLHIDWELKGSSAKELEIQETVKELGRKSTLFFRDQPIAKKEKLAKEIRALKIDLLTQQLEFNREKYAAESARTKAMFEPSKKDQVHALEVQGRLSEFERALKELKTLAKDKDKPLDCFDWQLDFPEVLNKHVKDDPGFDIVIGNPPYVRQELITDIKDDLARAYPETYTSTADLFVYFMQLGHEILRQNGTFTYIVSNKWMRSGYGANLKAYLSGQKLLQLLDFGSQAVFEATTYTCILLSQKAQASAGHRVLTWSSQDSSLVDLADIMSAQAHSQNQHGFVKADFRIGNASSEEFIAHLKASGKPLGKVLNGRIYRGVLTGYNKAFVVNRDQRDELIRQDKKSAALLKPFLVGKDIKRYKEPYSETFLIFTRRGTRISDYPAIERYLSQFRENLEPKPKSHRGEWKGRKSGPYKWYEIQDSTEYYREFEQEKILWPGISGEYTCFAWDANGYFGNDNNHLIVTKSKWLLGVLNSKLSAAYLHSTCDKVQGGFIRLKKSYIEEFPLIVPSATVQNHLTRLVEERLKPTIDSERAIALEREIDVLVCKLYGLSWEQAKVVDPELGVSKEAYEAMELPEAEGPTGQVAKEPGTPYIRDHGELPFE